MKAKQLSAPGLDAVLEIGGTGTLAQSLDAIRHGGHINIIGYMSGVDLGVTVFPLIIRNANLHGIGTGNREQHEALMAFVDHHRIKPVISASYGFDQVVQGLEDLRNGGHMGKLVVEY